MRLDLNCDLGEGCPFDSELMPLITSANVACGFHAGDPETARTTLLIAARYGVQVGAHPSFPDRESFGRTEMQRTAEQIFADCAFQIGALQALAKTAGVAVRYVKPHGALYNMACRDEAYARPVVAACAEWSLPVMGLPNSQLASAAEGKCRFIAEGFADRRYQPDGSLVPRSRPDAFVENLTEAVRQALWLMREKQVQTLCVHGDNPQAVAFVKALRTALAEQGVVVQSFA